MFDLGHRRLRAEGTAEVILPPPSFYLAPTQLTATGSTGNVWPLAHRGLYVHAIAQPGPEPSPILPPLVPEDLDPSAGMDGGPA